MKKSLLALLFAVALAVPALAENMWIGGSLGYNNSSPKNGDSTTSYYIEPEFGISLDDTWDIGIDFGYAYGENAWSEVLQVNDKITTFNVAPFARFKMFEIGDFSFLAKGSIFYESSKLDDADVDVTSYGLRIVPVVTYSINETWSIGATLDFASLTFSNSKCDDADVEVTEFGFDANNGSLIGVNFSYHF